MLPFLQLYGLYLIFYGHISPGGGFAGGAVIAAGFILYALAHDAELVSRRVADWLNSLAGIILILLGFVGIIRGSAYMFNIPEWRGQGGQLFSGGLIPLLATAIGLKVSSAVVMLYYYLVGEKKNV
jgi:multicomponent Na+:H+ antiporter subunit B